MQRDSSQPAPRSEGWPGLSRPPSVDSTAAEIAERRMRVFDRVMALFPPGRLIDLGAGHGSFSLRAAKLGWRVAAVDARAERFPVTDAVSFVQTDIRTVDLQPFDLVLCLGLWYTSPWTISAICCAARRASRW